MILLVDLFQVHVSKILSQTRQVSFSYKL